MAYHRVWSSVWTEPWTEDGRLLALYLLTCDHRTTEGLYRLPKAYMLADLGWTADRLQPAFLELVETGFAEYDDDAHVVLLLGALKRQQPANPNAATAAVRAIENLPETVLLPRFYALANTYSERLAERLRERFGQRLREPLRERFSQEWSDPPAPPPAPTPRASRHNGTLRARENVVPLKEGGIA